MIRRRFALVASAAVLTSCVSISPLPSQIQVAPYRDTITLTGTLSANYVQDRKPVSITVEYNWQQIPHQVDVSLALPLGQTFAEITLTPQLATLKQARHPPRVARDFDTLMNESLGWTLPVSGLRDWLQGYATDTSDRRFSASPANNNIVTKDGWHVCFVTWQDDSAAIPQPKRIDATRNVDGEQLAIRVIIRTID